MCKEKLTLKFLFNFHLLEIYFSNSILKLNENRKNVKKKKIL